MEKDDIKLALLTDSTERAGYSLSSPLHTVSLAAATNPGSDAVPLGVSNDDDDESEGRGRPLQQFMELHLQTNVAKAKGERQGFYTRLSKVPSSGNVAPAKFLRLEYSLLIATAIA